MSKKKKGKLPDTYEKWEQQGLLEIKLSGIRDMVSKRATQKLIAEYLGITEKTFIKLKKKHVKLAQAIDRGNEDLRLEAESKLLMVAFGHEIENVKTIIEESNSRQVKRIIREKKQISPNFAAIRYLFITKFGIDYNEKKEEIELMAKRLENDEESWSNENNNDEN